MKTKGFDELNSLFNEMFKTKDIKYTNDHNEMNICLINFIKLIETNNDKIAQKVFTYFFPPKTAKEKNENNFWFVKYKNDNYNEYLFALDILRFFIKYMKEKDEKKFYIQIDKISKNFKNYKNFNTYYSKVIKYIKDPLSIIQAYFSKDIQFYQDICDMNDSKYDIQSENFINELQSAILQSQINEIVKKVKNLEDDTLKLKKKNIETENKYKNLEDEHLNLEKKIKNLEDEHLNL